MEARKGEEKKKKKKRFFFFLFFYVDDAWFGAPKKEDITSKLANKLHTYCKIALIPFYWRLILP